MTTRTHILASITQPTNIDPDPTGRIPYRRHDTNHGWIWSTAWPTNMAGLYVNEYRTVIAGADDWDDPDIAIEYQLTTERGLCIPFVHRGRAVVIAAAEVLAAALPDINWRTVEKFDAAQVDIVIDTLSATGLTRL